MFGNANRMQSEGSFTGLRRDAKVLLLANREYDRLEAASVLVSFPGDFLETPSGFSEYANPLTISEETLGFDAPVQLEKSKAFGAYFEALSAGGHDFVISDTDLDPARWGERRIIVLPTLDYLDEKTQQSLVDFVAGGGCAAVGPKLPELDSLMNPCTILKDAVESGQGKWFVVKDGDDAASVLDQACTAAEVDAVRKSDARLDVVVHADLADEERRVVFVANPTAEAIEARVELPFEADKATELWSGQPGTVQGSQLLASMPAYSINVYDCSLKS